MWEILHEQMFINWKCTCDVECKLGWIMPEDVSKIELTSKVSYV